MKLTGRDATAYLAKPDPAHAAILIFGADAMRVADKRAAVVHALPEYAAVDSVLMRMWTHIENTVFLLQYCVLPLYVYVNPEKSLN